MSNTRRLMLGFAAAASVVTLAGASMAEPVTAQQDGRRGPPPAGAPDGPGRQGPGRPDPARREEALRERLKITPAQDGAFKAYLAATGRPERGQRPDREAFQAMTAPQKLDAQLAMAAQRQTELRARADAAKRFYAGLDAAQRATFDKMPPPAVLGIGRPGGGRRMAMRDDRRGGRDFGGRGGHERHGGEPQ